MKQTNKFCYLGSVLSDNAVIDDEIQCRIQKAAASFGLLQQRLWSRHGITSAVKVKVYTAAVLTILLYGGESWTLYQRHIKQLEAFHARCLRKILHVHWQDKIPNTEILERSNCVSIQAMLMRQQLRWTGHICRMEDNRLPKLMLYGELTTGYRSRGGQRKRFKDQLKKSLVHCHLDVDTWETLALDRSSWRSSTKSGVHEFELHRINEAMARRQRRKEVPLTVSDGTSSYICHVCGRVCRAKIGLISHLSTH